MDTPAVAPSSPPPPAALTDEQLAVITAARKRRKPIDRRAAMAAINGWSFAIFAAMSLPFIVFDPWSAPVCVVLALVAVVELRGRAMLQRLNPLAATVLGYNQLALGAAALLYFGWGLIHGLTDPDPFANYAQTDPAIADMLADYEGLYHVIVIAVYGGLIATIVPYQALIAWWYFLGAKHIQAFRDHTPPWVTTLLAKV